MANTNAIAGILSIPNVNGNAIVIASTEPSPGIAPIRMPKTVPTTIAIRVAGSRRTRRASASGCMRSTYILTNQGDVGSGMLRRKLKQYQVANGNSSATAATMSGRRNPRKSIKAAANGTDANRKPTKPIAAA